MPRLTSKQLHKGTGDVLKDLEHAIAFVDGDDVAGFLGKELDFINRALRVARGEIRHLRQRLERRDDSALLLAALKAIDALPSELAGDAWAIARAAIAKAEGRSPNTRTDADVADDARAIRDEGHAE